MHRSEIRNINLSGKMAGVSFITLFILFAYVAALGGCVFAMFVADADAAGLKGAVSRFVLRTVPSSLSDGVIRILGKSSHEAIVTAIDYVFHRRNPILQVIYSPPSFLTTVTSSSCLKGAYLLIINGAFATWLIFGHPILPTYLVPRWHGHVALILVLASQFTFYLACTTDPGTITTETHRSYNHYKFDNLLYVDNSMCKTCLLSKIPRSPC